MDNPTPPNPQTPEPEPAPESAETPAYVLVKFAGSFSVLHTIEFKGVHPLQILVAGEAVKRAAEGMIERQAEDMRRREALGSLVDPMGRPIS